jgi:hypothetical protein
MIVLDGLRVRRTSCKGLLYFRCQGPSNLQHEKFEVTNTDDGFGVDSDQQRHMIRHLTGCRYLPVNLAWQARLVV